MAAYARSGGTFNNQITANLPKNHPVKKNENQLRSDRIMDGHEFVASLFWPNLYTAIMVLWQFIATGFKCQCHYIHSGAVERVT